MNVFWLDISPDAFFQPQWLPDHSTFWRRDVNQLKC